MKLFNGKVEKDARFAKYSESHYKFMSKSMKPEYIIMRSKFEEWFSHYPAKEKHEFIKRFQIDNDEQFLSAFFELLIHELLLKLNYSIEIHPHLYNSEKHPDFLVFNKTGEEFYVEVATVTSKSKEEIGRQKLMNNVMDSINDVKTSNYFIEVNISRFPSKPIPANRIRNFLQVKLNELNPDHCEEIINKYGWGAVPNWDFNYKGWEIQFMPIPRDRKYRKEDNSNPIGITHYPMHFNDNKKSIMSVLKKKAKKYNNIDKPYIIVLNGLDISMNREEIFDTLFGATSCQYDYTNSDISKKIRIPNGFWRSGKGASYTRVSAVILIQKLYPWSIGMNGFKIYHNPWAKYSCSGNLCKISNYKINNDEYIETPGATISNILGLSDRWPHDL